MKTLFIIVATTFLFTFSALAEEAKEPEPQFSVHIVTHYNSVDEATATKIHKEAMKAHGKACTVEITTTKLSPNTLYISDLVSTPSGSLGTQ